MNYTSEGIIKFIGPVKQVTDNFSKREFVITTNDTYPQTVSFQLMNTHCNKIDTFQIGDSIQVHFNIAGKPWKNATGVEFYFNSLNVFKIDLLVGKVETPSRPVDPDYMSDDLSIKRNITTSQSNSQNDDLPF